MAARLRSICIVSLVQLGEAFVADGPQRRRTKLHFSPAVAGLCFSTVLGLRSGDCRLGRTITPPLVSVLSGAALSNFGMVPSAAPCYTACWEVALPLSLSLTLLGRQKEAGNSTRTRRVVAAFVIGSCGSVAGALASHALGMALGLDPATSLKAASCLLATYVGGSANFFAVAKLLGLDAQPALLTSLAAADVALMAAYFALCKLLAGPTDEKPALLGRLARDDARHRAAAGAVAVACFLASTRAPRSLATLSLVALSLAAGELLKGILKLETAAASLAAVALQLFYAALGAQARIADAAASGAAASAMAATCLGGHALILAVASRARLWTRREALVASNACVGGPSTAAAFASTVDASLVLPAVVTGTIGYAVATDLGKLFYRSRKMI